MKAIAFLLSFFVLQVSYGQFREGITPADKKPHANVENLYSYQPPEHLQIPDKIYASVVYNSKNWYYTKVIPINKTDSSYQFLFAAPDSTQVLLFSIIDDKKNTIDNNNDLGFKIYLYDNNGAVQPSARLAAADLLGYYAPRILKLNAERSREQAISLYEEGYKMSPALKNENSYRAYLSMLYEEKKDTVKPELIAYARKMAAAQNDEQKWMNAINIYSVLKMVEEKQKVESKVLSKKPNGQLAIRKFWDEFYSVEKPTEQTILLSMNEYMARFKDSSSNTKNLFYSNIISFFLHNKQWENINKYELLIENKFNNLAGLYNNYAWNLSGQELFNPGTDLEVAKSLSRKSIDYAEEQMEKLTANGEQGQELQGSHNTFADTYALILYKLGQYDSAFYYQDAIYKQRGELDEGGLERYAAYAEKAKGADYARHVIEEQLLSGVHSPAMLQQLQSIYKKLNLPGDQFKKMQEKYNSISRQKTAEVIKAKMGTTAAKNFTLKNISGQQVSLSSLKDKVVVLDFWATWCGPCRASFPAMQETINKYKEDSTVAFLFIDVWENKPPVKMREAAAKFIKDNNYSFNVLLDLNDKVVGDYRVDGIPAKFVIDKKGNIVFMGESSNISLEIENARTQN